MHHNLVHVNLVTQEMDIDIDYCDSNSCDPNNTIGHCIDGQGGINVNNFISNCKVGLTTQLRLMNVQCL